MNVVQQGCSVLDFWGRNRNPIFQLAIVAIFQHILSRRERERESQFDFESDLRSAMDAKYYTQRVKWRLYWWASTSFAEVFFLFQSICICGSVGIPICMYLWMKMLTLKRGHSRFTFLTGQCSDHIRSHTQVAETFCGTRESALQDYQE
jgi:hypothetical protein